MLLLSRKVGERIQIGDDITLTIEQIKGKQVKVSISAPRSVEILRHELLQPGSIQSIVTDARGMS